MRQIKIELTDPIELWQATDPDLPFWLVVQAFGTGVRPKNWDPPTASHLRLMVNLALARGTRAITYFGFGSTPDGFEDINGISRWPFVPTDQRYAEVGAINAKIHALRPLLTSWKWVKSLPQKTEDFDVQLLAGAGGRQFVWVTNSSFEEPKTGSIAMPGTKSKIDVSLPPGHAKVFNLSDLSEVPIER